MEAKNDDVCSDDNFSQIQEGGRRSNTSQGQHAYIQNSYDHDALDDQWIDAGSSQEEETFVDGLVISILIITAITNSAYAIIAPFLPFEFKKKQID